MITLRLIKLLREVTNLCKGDFHVCFSLVVRKTTTRNLKSEFQSLVSGIITQPIVKAAISDNMLVRIGLRRHVQWTFILEVHRTFE